MAATSVLDLPKAHLHVHLDGAYPVDAVMALAGRRGRAFAIPDSFADVWAFFDAYGTVPALIESHDDLAALCRALVAAEAAQGVVYLEPAIEPQLYADRLGGLEQATRTILAGLAEGASDTGIEVGACLTVNTDGDEAIATELADIAIRFAGSGVTAFGTACFDEPLDLTPFVPAARTAIAGGLQVVSHAGQTAGPDRVEAVLDQLGATRISHGVRAIDSPALLERMAREAITCDVCPDSNVRLHIAPTLDTHPAPRLQAAGVPVTLNADDPLWFHCTITGQYETARTVWGLDDDRIAGFARAGANAAGMSAATRSRLLTGIDTWLLEEGA